MIRAALILALCASACISDAEPLVFTTTNGIRIQPADEAGDEWLHSHCVFHGMSAAESTGDVIAAAQQKHANFAEPLSRSTEERGFWTRVLAYDVAYFACTERPPF